MKAKPTKGNGKVAAWPQAVKAVVKAASRDHAPSASRKAALKRIGVSEVALRTAPAITSLLRQADGGLRQVYSAMRMSSDATIRAYLAKFDSVPKDDRRRISMEAIALAAGVNISSLLGAIMLALETQAASLVRLLAVTAHPRITQARIRYGVQPGGHRDRTSLDQILGLLPNPKGTMFIGHAVFGSGQDVMQAQRQLPGRHGHEPDDEDEEREPPIAADGWDADRPDLNKLFPPANEMQERLNLIRNRQLSEDTGKPAPRWLKN